MHGGENAAQTKGVEGNGKHIAKRNANGADTSLFDLGHKEYLVSLFAAILQKKDLRRKPPWGMKIAKTGPFFIQSAGHNRSGGKALPKRRDAQNPWQ
jgi:hypothetical protein